MTKKDEVDAKPVLATGASGDPQHPDAAAPVGYRIEADTPETEIPAAEAKKEHKSKEGDK